MTFRAASILLLALFAALNTQPYIYAQCPVDSVVVKGRIAHLTPNAIVRARLLYRKHQNGESAEAALDSETFNLPMEFLTQSNKPLLLSSMRARCDRKPQTVVITLMEGDNERDSVTLDFSKDFKKNDSGVYVPSVEIVLKNEQP